MSVLSTQMHTRTFCSSMRQFITTCNELMNTQKEFIIDSLSVQKVSVRDSICSSFFVFSFSLIALLLGFICHVISGQFKTTHRA